MIDSRVFLKLPLDFQDKCKIYPPTLEEVLSNEYFSTFIKVLTISQEDIEDEAVEKGEAENFLTPLEYLLAVCYQNPKAEEIIKIGFQFFIKEEVTFLYDVKSILIGKIEDSIMKVKSVGELRLINEENYFNFQNLIRMSLGEKQIEKIEETLHPKVREMKAKARKRDRIKAKQGGGISLQTSLEAICCMGIGITPLNIGKLSYAAITALMNRYQMKEKYDIDIKSIMAGAKANQVNPTYWISNQE